MSETSATSTSASRISEIIRQQEQGILSDWTKHQLSGAGLRPGLIKESELREECSQFLHALAGATRKDTEVNLDSPVWAPVRDLLVNLSRSRARQGFTPVETATFVFSLKRTLFSVLRREFGNEAAALADEMWTVTNMLDKLGLYTLEIFQKTREEVIARQHQELLRTLDELNRRQEELTHLNNELEDTNRGVMALYSELDEKALHLRRADEMKSRFLSNMSHEFRTPLNSILALSRLLLNRIDGDLTAEQERQVSFIRKSAQDLFDLVNDLLDLAKVEAGRIDVRTSTFDVSSVFGALRGMLRPLLHEGVDLIFEETGQVPALQTDESKVGQILRNFISNALKFTERGEVRVSARYDPEREAVVFSVSDTGIGIAAADQEMIFEEFTQLPNALQKQVRGTGLGLPLSKKLAELLGGAVQVESVPGEGSMFSAVIPVAYVRHKTAGAIRQILIIDDEETSRYMLKQCLAGGKYSIIEANTGESGLRQAKKEKPNMIFLDLKMPDLDGAAVLDQLKADPVTHDVPVIVFTSKQLGQSERDTLSRKASAILTKDQLSVENVNAAIITALRVPLSAGV